MISKELLSEVLGIGVYQSIRKDEYAYNDVKLNIINTELLYNYVNIYELAYKCKEWAFYAYKISVSSFKSGSFYLKEFNQIKDNSEYWVELDTASIDCEINIDDSGIFKSCSEPEAIFKACQWILDNKGIK